MKTAFSRFDNLKSTPGLFPGQDSLKNHFLPKWDVFYVDDPTDYSILKEKENEITTKYVWLIKKGIEIYPSFPWYYMPNQLATFKFPYVFEKSREVKSYDLVRLVSRDAHWNRFIEIEEKYIAGHYSPYKGQEKFDIFYIGEDKTVHNNLIERGFKVQSVDTVEQAREQSFTDMFWIVYDDTVVRDTFKFSYKPDSKTKFYAVQRLMYQHKHQFPPSFITVNGKKYLLPTWKEVHPDTTFDDVIHVKPESKKPVKEEKTFASKSDPTITYKATRTTYPSGEIKHYCNCPGKWRAKDGMCKHLKFFA